MHVYGLLNKLENCMDGSLNVVQIPPIILKPITNKIILLLRLKWN